MLEKYSEKLEFNRFGIIVMSLLIVASFGGIAAGFVMDNLPLLTLIVISCLTVETLILAVQPVSRILVSSIISLTISFGSILLSLL